MTDHNILFDRLSERLGAPGSKYFPDVLESMMTPDEAEMLLEITGMMNLDEIAERMNLDKKTLQAKLDDMEERQIIRKAGEKYYTPPNVLAFHHGAIGWMQEDLKAKAYPLWGKFFFAEWRDILVDGFLKRKENGAPGSHRVMPATKALKLSPDIDPKDILWYEDMEQVFRKSEKISVMMCGCRGLWRKCENPIDTCVIVQYHKDDVEVEAPHYMKPPTPMTLEESLTALEEWEDRGLVHIPLNTSEGDMYCNCCDDCCMVINPLLHRGKVHEILTPSRFRASVDPELCNGCQVCMKRCKFDAIEMEKIPDSKNQKSHIIDDNCLGCGACVITCKQKAMTLNLIRPPEHIPTVSVMELFKWGQKVME